MFFYDLAQTLGKHAGNVLAGVGGCIMRKPDFRYAGIEGALVISQTDVKDWKQALFWATHAVAESKFSADCRGGGLKMQFGRN